MASFTGGDKLQAALAEIARNATKDTLVRVGFLEGSKYPDGTPVPLVAAINEFGAPSRGIPPRPYFRGMIQEKSGEWPRAIAGLLRQTDYDGERTMALTGQAIKGQLQQSIASFSGVPLAPATIARKGSTKQLVDTGHMLNSVDYEVK